MSAKVSVCIHRDLELSDAEEEEEEVEEDGDERSRSRLGFFAKPSIAVAKLVGGAQALRFSTPEWRGGLRAGVEGSVLASAESPDPDLNDSCLTSWLHVTFAGSEETWISNPRLGEGEGVRGR
jgi:hypothetical protein